MEYANTIHTAFSSLTIHILLISCSFLTTTTGTGKLALRLIHRHSVFPPKLGLSDYKDDDYKDDIRAPLIPAPDGSIFLVNISIGEPPIPQLLALDTGSHLLWVQCSTCDGCHNIFDSKKSSTYTKLYGDSYQCSNFIYFRSKTNECRFEIKYEDQSSSAGFLALETFTFLTSSGGTVKIPDLIFGCAQKSSRNVRDLNGVLGLESHNHFHLAGRLGNKFSYCIGNIDDPRYMYNRLILGDGAVIQGDSTPMRFTYQHYSVSVEGISVGRKNLKINQDEFHFNVVVDSGSTAILLVTSAYVQLVEEVERLMDGVAKRRDSHNGYVCYFGDLESVVPDFPIVTLHLAEGAKIEMDAEGMFQRTRDGSGFCLDVLESGFNLIGARAQQYYNVGFDLNAQTISFQRIDCELLED